MQKVNPAPTHIANSEDATKPDRHQLIALLLTASGLILRLVGLGARPLWFDEAISVDYARQTIPVLFSLNSGDNHPVGYYLTLKGWIMLFGDSDAIVRLLSVIPGVLAIWLTWLIGKRLFPNSPRLVLLAVALMAFSPFQIYFSQEARNYSFMQLFVMLAIWYWLRGLEKNQRWDWAMMGVATALGLVFNITTSMYIAAIGLVMLFGWKRYWRNGMLLQFVVANGIGTLVASVALVPKLNRLSVVKDYFWVPVPDLLTVMRTFYTFIFGASPTNLLMPSLALAFVILFIVLVQVILGLVRQRKQVQPNAENLPVNPLLLTFWLLFGPLLLVFVVSIVYQPIYLDKALMACAPFYFLLIGWTIFKPGQEKKFVGRFLAYGTPVVLAIILVVVTLPALYTGTINPLYIARYDATRIDSYLASRFQSGDVVATATDVSMLPLLYYDAKKLPIYPIAEYPYPNVFPALLDKIGTAFVSQADFAKNYKRAWVVFEVTADENTLNNPPRPANLATTPSWFHSPQEQTSTFNWFNRHYKRLDAVYLDRVLLVLYDLRSPAS